MVCTQCGSLNQDNRELCFRCNHSLSRITAKEEGNCHWHPLLASEANCSVCGLPMCDACGIRVEDVAYCPQCADIPGGDRVRSVTEDSLSAYDMATYPTAVFGWRFMAGVIDGFVVGSGIVVLALLFWMFSGVPMGMPWRQGSNTAFWLLVALGAGAYFVSYFVDSGQTPGYSANDLLLVRRDGQSVTLPIAIIRYVVSLISALCFGLGYLWMIWDPDNQTWHDKVAGTLVLHTSDRKELAP